MVAVGLWQETVTLFPPVAPMAEDRVVAATTMTGWLVELVVEVWVVATDVE